MAKFIHDFKVVENRPVNKDYFVLYLECPIQLPPILPGQFVQVQVHSSPTTYLRRPISIYDVDRDKNQLLLLIKKVGNGTKALSSLKVGEYLNLVYPLGNSFSIPHSGRVLLIGGGVGIAPMLYLAKYLKTKNVEAHVLIGGKSTHDIIECDKYKPYCEVYITTDDGSLGEKGLVTQHSLFGEQIKFYDRVYVCGPNPMMIAVSKLVEKYNIPCEVSLENMMACGIGACLCCVAPTPEGNKTTCVEGPVFNSKDLKW